MSGLDRVFGFVTAHSRITIIALLLATLAIGAGASQVEVSASIQGFEIDNVETEKLEYADESFSGVRENVTVAQIVVRGDNVLQKETLLATLELQKEIRDDEEVSGTLVDDQPTVGIANTVAHAAILRQDPTAESPTLDEQIDALESMDQDEIDAILTSILDGDADPPSQAFIFMPTDYEPGSTTAESTMIAVFQKQEVDSIPGDAPDHIVDSQSEILEIAADSDAGEEALVVGNGIVTDEMQRSQQDSMKIIGPLALLFVLVTLVVIYRDLLDILLGLVGIALVLVWTFGFLGWTGVPFNPSFISVPVLLIGLSIDYAIHVFMRYREHRSEGTATPRKAMAVGLAGVGSALVWVTVTTAIGFLSNLASPVPPIQDIGIISVIGIVSALFVFGGLIPAVKIELENLLERIGFERRKRPIGTGESRFVSVLSVGVTAARKAPIAVVFATLLVSAGAAYGATNVSTSFKPQDFFPEDAPEWTESLPEKLQPGEYTAKRNMEYVNEQFVSPNSQAQIVVEGDITQSEALGRVADAEAAADEKSVVLRLSNDQPEMTSPLSIMNRVAAENESFNATFAAADTDGDGVPDQNIEGVYDDLYAAAPDEANRVIQREDGEYVAMRMVVAIDDTADDDALITQMRDVAAELDSPGTTATATGRPILLSLVRTGLLDTLVNSLAVTLLAVFVILAVAHRLIYGSATLGVVTLLPVALCVSWIMGSMYLLSIPLSVLTAILGGLTIGIGVDYSIHISERYVQELGAGKPPGQALYDTVAGTGSALSGSAVTTMGGFGVMALALFPLLQQFGIMTALTIAYAFLASVFVLPSFLLLWTRYVGGTHVHEGTAADRDVSPAPQAED